MSLQRPALGERRETLGQDVSNGIVTGLVPTECGTEDDQSGPLAIAKLDVAAQLAVGRTPHFFHPGSMLVAVIGGNRFSGRRVCSTGPVGSEAAIEAITRRATANRAGAASRWAASAPDAGSIERWASYFRNAGRLTLNFHPDRIARSGLTVAAGLAADGHYRSQWTTGVTAGSRSAITGGERQRFEREFFDGAYESIEASTGEHPVYGALDVLFDQHGGSPRFGSCFVVLEQHVRERTTFSLGDSHLAPPDVATFAEPWSVLAGLAEQAQRGELLGRRLGGDDLLQVLEGNHRSNGPARNLDGYIEAQVHGGVSLGDDVEMIVLDPSFHGSAVESDITAAAERYGFDLAWHGGSEIEVEEVPDDFRGPSMPAIASRVARADGIVGAHAIGVAALEDRFEEPTSHGDPQESPRQQLKYLWHTLLAHGRDAGGGDSQSHPNGG